MSRQDQNSNKYMKKIYHSHFSSGKWKKTMHLMNLKIAIMLCCIGNLSAGPLLSQQATYDVYFRDVSIASALDQLKSQTGYTFVRMAGLIDKTERVTVSLKEATIEQILDQMLVPKGYSYQIAEGIVVITEAEQPAGQAPASPRVITGSVRTSDGVAVVSASVYVKDNPRTGTVTDAAGRFSLTLPDNRTVTIVVSYISMVSQEFALTSQNDYAVTLRESSVELSTVTVSTGYVELNRAHVTGAVTVITQKDLENLSFQSLDQALAGLVPGLLSVSTSGAPGARAEIRIRGDNSISGNKEPLWVVDGLPLQQGVAPIQDLTNGDIQQSILDHGVGNLSPSDIESVTILKDAAASAIYGAMAANGVIVVKTKRGGESPVSVTYRGSFALGQAPVMDDFGFMNAAEKVRFEIDLMEEFGQRDMNNGQVSYLWFDWKRGSISDDEYYARIAELSAVDVNRFKEIYGVTFSHDHSLSMRAGSEKFWFYGSLNARDEKGALKSNRFNQFGANIKIGYNPHKNITVDFDLTGGFRESNDHASAVNPFNYAVFANPYEKLYNEDGSYAADKSWLNDKSLLSAGFAYENFNILNEMENTFNKQRASDISTTLSFRWKITPQLLAELHGRIGYSNNNGERGAAPGTYTSKTQYWSLYPFGGTGIELPEKFNLGNMTTTSGNATSYSARASLSYNNSFADKHFLSVFLGTEISSSESRASSMRLMQYEPAFHFGTAPDYGWTVNFDPNIQRAVGGLGAYSYGNIKRTASFLSSLTYSYDNRYVFNANVRFDGAGTIDAKNRFTPLWSASVRWNIHHENLVKEYVPFISELAVRAVYGFTGNIDHRALPYSWIILSGARYAGRNIANNVYFPNPSIKWELKKDRNIGVDFSFFDNLFGGSFNYYDNVTERLLGSTRTAPSFGNPRLVMNGYDLSNKGWELGLFLRLRFSDDFRWNVSFNIAKNVNRVKNSKFANPFEYDQAKNNKWEGFTANDIENYPTGTTFGYRYAGVNPDNGEAMFYLSDEARRRWAEAAEVDISEIPLTWDFNAWTFPEELIYKISERDEWFMLSMTKIGQSQPDYYGGFTSTWQWKNFELRAGFSYMAGHTIRSFDGRNFIFAGNNNPNSTSELYGLRVNVLRETANRWRVPGDETDVPRFTKGTSLYFKMNSSDRFQKGDYLHMRDLSLNYYLHGRIIERIGMEYVRIGIQVDNLATFTKAHSTDITTGNAFGYPRTRKYLLNLQLTF